MLEAIVARLSATISHFVDGRAEQIGASRFFRNPKVKPAEIIEVAATQTAQAAAGRHVLLIQDTSEVNYQAKSGRKRNLGRVGNDEDVGLFVHPALAVDAEDGSVLGLAGATIWRRTAAKAKDYQAQPIESKETRRWIDTPQISQAALSQAGSITVVADREADVYEFLSRVPDLTPAKGKPIVHVLVRCNHDRALAQKNGGCLRAHIATWPEAGRLNFDLTARPGRPARNVTLAVRFGPVTIRQPKVGADKRDPRKIAINVVEVREINPPPGTKEPVIWRLYTTHPVNSMEDAERIVELYRRRWTIEQFFRTLKSKGLDLESNLIADGQALENVAALSMVAVVKVMQCVHARGEAGAQIPATRVFSEADLNAMDALLPKLEGKTEKQKNPYPYRTMAWAVWIIARLGGWTGYQKARPPGPITMHRGLQRFEAIVQGFTLAYP